MDVPENLTANLHLLWPEFLITGLAFVVLTMDFLLPRERKNVLAAVSIVGMVAIAVFSVFFLGNEDDTPLYEGIFLVDRFSLVFKIIFLGLGVLIVLASAASVASSAT